MNNAQQVTDSSTIAPVIMLISAVGNYKNSSRIHFLYWMLLVGLLRWMWASSHRGISTGTNNWYSLAEVNLSLSSTRTLSKRLSFFAVEAAGECIMISKMEMDKIAWLFWDLAVCLMDRIHVVARMNLPWVCDAQTSVKILILLISFRQLFGTDGITEIGAIHKMYSGFCQELCTTARNFMYQGKLSTCCFCHHITSVSL